MEPDNKQSSKSIHLIVVFIVIVLLAISVIVV
jgi:hypothetical protein